MGNGTAGGSGGGCCNGGSGGASNQTAGATPYGGSVTAYGNAGGATGQAWTGCGGGGAGSAGVNGNICSNCSPSGNGGQGKQFSISSSTVYYAGALRAAARAVAKPVSKIYRARLRSKLYRFAPDLALVRRLRQELFYRSERTLFQEFRGHPLNSPAASRG